MAYQAFAFLCSMLAISVLSSFFFRARFSIRRILPSVVSASTNANYEIEIQNLTDKPQAGLLINEQFEDPRPTMEQLLADNSGPSGFNLGYKKWRSMLLANKKAVVREQSIATIPARGKIRVTVELTPLRRGHLRFHAVSIMRPDPFGLVKAKVVIPENDNLLILPKQFPVRPILLPGKRRYHKRRSPARFWYWRSRRVCGNARLQARRPHEKDPLEKLGQNRTASGQGTGGGIFYQARAYIGHLF